MRKDLIRMALIGACGVAGGAFVVMAPQVHAIAAALVQVANTAANPVPTKQADHFALHAWGQRVFPSPSFASKIQVPADRYLVIDSVSGFAFSATVLAVGVNVVTNGVVVAQDVAFDPARSGESYLKPNSIHVVADPGSTVTITVEDAVFNDPGGINIDLGGYFVTPG
jgi:hypothetical protein